MVASPAAFRFDPETHCYTVGGVKVPSVSEVLRLAGLVDYSKVPPGRLKRKAELGSTVHANCYLHDQGDLDPDSIDNDVKPYLAAWRLFRLAHPCEILASEQMFLGELDGLRFGGTLDRLVKLEGRSGILDIKCTYQAHPHHAIQTAGYAIALESLGTPARRVSYYRRSIVYLRKDATFEVRQCLDPHDGDIFAAALRIAHWKLGHPDGRL